MKKIDHHTYEALRAEAEVIEQDLFGEKVIRLADGSYLKLFRRKRLLSSALWSPYANRFAENALALAALRVPVPKVIDVFRIPSIGRDAVRYEPLAGSTLRALARDTADAAERDRLKASFNRFVVELHDKGIYFRSLHLGNVVLTPDGRMGLIDFSDLRIYPRALPRNLKQRNIRRISSMPGDAEWVDRATIIGGVTA